MKNVKFCPICGAKKIIHSFQLNTPATKGYNNGAALTPPMGWSSWNLFREKISEELIKEIAKAMADSGLREAGYQFVNIDDCWQSSSRDENGKLQSDKITFPSGIKALREYVNSLGLKLGIYSSNGTLTCEDYPATLGNEAIDADTFAEWGVEYFKQDFCHNVAVPTKAPYIIKIGVGRTGENDFCTKYACEAALTGNARLIEDNAIDGCRYIKGLCSGNGTAEFNGVTVPEDGDYVLTLTIRKSGREDKFAIVTVNGEDKYELTAPGTKSPTPEGRLQLNVKLKAGSNSIRFSNPIGSVMDSAFYQYKKMGEELKRATKEYAEKTGQEEKKIVFSICEWGLRTPWKWGREAGNLWRTTPDIQPNWFSISAIYELTVRLGKYAGIGGWNDPDMLEVGNGNLTYEENKSHFSLWCMMCAPLILGNDIRKFIKPDGTVDTDNKTYKIITNKYLISINQDSLGVPCKKLGGVSKSPFVDVLVKPLSGARAAVCIFNKDSKPSEVQVDISKIADSAGIDLEKKASYHVTDCWGDRIFDTATIKAEPEKHGVEVFIIE